MKMETREASTPLGFRGKQMAAGGRVPRAREKPREAQDAKPNRLWHICAAKRSICQLAINVKPNWQTVGEEILSVLAKTQECQTYLQNCWSCSNWAVS